MACMVKGFPQISLLSVRIRLRFFTEEGSYQWLKDATSFGLLSNKTAEKLGGKFEFLPILYTGHLADMDLCVHLHANEAVTSLLPHLHTKKHVGQAASMENF